MIRYTVWRVMVVLVGGGSGHRGLSRNPQPFLCFKAGHDRVGKCSRSLPILHCLCLAHTVSQLRRSSAGNTAVRNAGPPFNAPMLKIPYATNVAGGFIAYRKP